MGTSGTKKIVKECLNDFSKFLRYQIEVADFLSEIGARTSGAELTAEYKAKVRMPCLEGSDVKFAVEYVNGQNMGIAATYYFPTLPTLDNVRLADSLELKAEQQPFKLDNITVIADIQESRNLTEYRFGGYDVSIRITGRKIEFMGTDEGKRDVNDKAYQKAIEKLEAAARKHRLIPKKGGED